MFRKLTTTYLILSIVFLGGCQAVRYTGPYTVDNARDESDEWRVIETIDNAPVVSGDEIQGIVVEPKAAVPPEEAPVKSLKKRNVILFIVGMVALGIAIGIVSMSKGSNGGGGVMPPPDDITPPNGEPIDDIMPGPEM